MGQSGVERQLMKDFVLVKKALESECQKDNVCLNQEYYVQQLLERFGIGDCVRKATPADLNQQRLAVVNQQRRSVDES